MEKLVRRQMVLEAAYKESEVGSYEGAEYLMGEDEQPADGSTSMGAIDRQRHG